VFAAKKLLNLCKKSTHEMVSAFWSEYFYEKIIQREFEQPQQRELLR
jgi:hypothetical protein